VRILITTDKGGAAAIYRNYVEEVIREGVMESPWEQLQDQVLLGGASLRKKVKRLVHGSRREQRDISRLERREFSDIIEVVSRLKGEPWLEYRDRRGDWGRDLALWLGRRYCGLRLSQLGGLVGGLDYAAVSLAIARLSARIPKERALQKCAAKAIRMLNVEI
jgi:hypothetical protein